MFEDDIKQTVSSSELPWLWIGIKNENGCITVTNDVNKTLRYDEYVTPSYLSVTTGLLHGKWYYIDSETLEEKEFPSEGFIIRNVSSKSISDSE